MTDWTEDHDRYTNCEKTWINSDGAQLIVQDLREVLDTSLLPDEQIQDRVGSRAVEIPS